MKLGQADVKKAGIDDVTRCRPDVDDGGTVAQLAPQARTPALHTAGRGQGAAVTAASRYLNRDLDNNKPFLRGYRPRISRQ